MTVIKTLNQKQAKEWNTLWSLKFSSNKLQRTSKRQLIRLYVNTGLLLSLSSVFTHRQMKLFLKILKHFLSFSQFPASIYHCEFLVPSISFSLTQDPADPLPLVLLCGGTLRSDNFLQCSEAVETLCGTACFPVPCQWGSPESRQQWEAGSQRSRGLGRLEGGSWRQTSSKVGGLVGIHRQRYTSK